MGQHKYNPTAIAAKKGEIKPRIKEQSNKDLFRDYLATKFPFVSFVEKIVKGGAEE